MSHPNFSNDDRNPDQPEQDESQIKYLFMRGDQFLHRAAVSRLERIYGSACAPESELPPDL
ncbi:hypothetical protein [Gloeobacter kilaueensis]|uniref:Uncharacterized protein n=1 Tax=Gloeobacter kilaueensis (strain ATCC BAA-2537 / CCAP 1431/1 / ULC 316 / JS1) TaxID=1183438 RepID=U5QI95_GLOK1|nr:hypothetical protein [Gloeobacter kilaueensis]AGY57365.1 hypothetical protein GKIL_1119 [Gloeobacter kilaueensis JS1]